MKFGKRVASEAARSSHQKDFLDYKACKRAIQQDVLSNGMSLPPPSSFLSHFISLLCDLWLPRANFSKTTPIVSSCVQIRKARRSRQCWSGS